jgi:hypothetical protein
MSFEQKEDILRTSDIGKLEREADQLVSLVAASNMPHSPPT